MRFAETKIKGVFIIEPVVYKDNRGYFCETFKADEFEKNVGNVHFVQENENKSSYGVLRGIHFQNPPYAQSKLVRVIHGRVLDVAVDIRHGSPTYGKSVACELTADNHLMFFIPKGFAHGFVVLSEDAVFQYKCDDFYHPESEGAIAWNDPDLAIDWCIPLDDIILSAKDQHHPRLCEIETQFSIDVEK